VGGIIGVCRRFEERSFAVAQDDNEDIASACITRGAGVRKEHHASRVAGMADAAHPGFPLKACGNDEKGGGTAGRAGMTKRAVVSGRPSGSPLRWGMGSGWWEIIGVYLRSSREARDHAKRLAGKVRRFEERSFPRIMSGVRMIPRSAGFRVRSTRRGRFIWRGCAAHPGFLPKACRNDEKKNQCASRL